MDAIDGIIEIEKRKFMSQYELDANFHVEQMTRKELDKAMLWAKHEGWNFGIHDAEVIYGIDPEGFWVGKMGDEVISCCSALRYEKDYAFVGLYIVDEAYRGKGYGKAVWDKAIRRIDEMGVKYSGLDAVVEQVPRYESEGYEAAHTLIRMRYEANGQEIKVATVHEMEEGEVGAICEYDKGFDVESRGDFTKRWLEVPGGIGIYWASRRYGDVLGYGFMREAVEGYMVGPMYAHDVTMASEILDGMCSMLGPMGHLSIDVPEANGDAMRLMKSRGLEEVTRFVRMYRGGKPEMRIKEIYGVKSVAVG